MIFKTETMYNEESLRGILQQHSVDFFDFGCSKGGGTLWGQKQTKKIGMGFDRCRKKIQAADENGIFCAVVDILKIPGSKIINDIIMFHFLEHLASVGEAKLFIEKAITLAKSTVTIKQPFFDSDCSLLKEGLKTYYSHWIGHPNRMTSFDFLYILTDFKQNKVISDFEISYKKRICNSESEIIIPYTAKIDSLSYDKALHGEKSIITFNYSLFYEIMIAIDLDGSGFGKIYEALSPDEVLKI